MEITRNNYEQYFLDYLEGKLDERLVDEFIEFLQNNSDLKQELQSAGSFKLNPEPVVFAGKEKLYKNRFDLPDVFDDAAVAYIEGDLSEEDRAEFETYLSAHPGKQKDVELFKSTRLVTDDSIAFPGKSRLLRQTKGKILMLWFTRVAAVLTVAFLVYRFAGDVAVDFLMPGDQVLVSENEKEKSAPTQLPEKVEKEQDPVPVKENTATPVKKAEPKTQPAKSLRESNEGRIDHEKVALVRDPIETPGEIPALTASLHDFNRETISLVPLNIDLPEPVPEENEERLFADVVLEKTGLNNISLKKVAAAGLNLVSSFSKEKFNYETNTEGKITELNFDSRLLAFSIPTGQGR